MKKTLFKAGIVFILILFLAALPMIMKVNEKGDSIDWNMEKLPEIYASFIIEMSQGSLGTYQLGQQEREISADIGNNFVTSLEIVLVGVIAGVVLSIFFGIFISRFRFTRIINLMINLLAAIPDFILIIVSLIIAVKIFKQTGIRVISLRPDTGALNIWFPMILVSLAPTLYLFKLVGVKYFQTSGEDYIRTAVAKGMGVNYINFHHVFKNVEPFIVAELTKVISLAIGNLFIIEYLLNVSGITKFIFQSNEVQPIAIGLFCMLLISVAVYFSVRALLYLFKRGFVYE
ncbi:ABC transporter permease subunit [Bacillus sp. T33-2]|uniref:ABC transporter permease subunit n=1 Tax=Bacillus sp. T33-2 TaxID=2054168 RepID=UPI0021554224|nr:ABC transporter permease subunit [Bacillus sp. T33-2]